MQTDPSGLGTDRVLPEHELARLAGIPPTTWRRMLARGETPSPIQLSQRRRGYWQSESLAWLEARTARAA